MSARCRRPSIKYNFCPTTDKNYADLFSSRFCRKGCARYRRRKSNRTRRRPAISFHGAYVIVGFADGDGGTESVLNELKTLGTLANAVKSDITTVAGTANLIAEVEKMFGRIDLLVNCLRFQSDSEFEETMEDAFEKTIDQNLKSAFFVTQAALPLMKTRPKPEIVNVVSAIDTPETELDAVFAALQNALIGLTKSLAKSLPKKFRVNVVAVSEKKTVSENLDAELFRPTTNVSADDATRTIVYLLSAEAVGLNGQILTIE